MKSALPLIALLFLFQKNLTAQVVINEVSAANLTGQTANGEYEDWVELFNPGPAAVNLTGWFLSDNPAKPQKWPFTTGFSVPAGGHRLIFCSGKNLGGAQPHTNFKLTQTKGESVILTNPSGVQVDLFTFDKPTQVDHSFGRTPNGGPDWRIFSTPTPNAVNGPTLFSKYAAKVKASVDAGFFTGNVSVNLTSDPGLTIRFTTNGSEPTAASAIFSAPLNFTATTVLKARAFSPDADVLPGFVLANTYFINENHTIPVISVAGNTIETLLGGSSNRPFGSFEYFENGKEEAESYGEFNKHGNDSWAYPQRGIDWITRDQMGYDDEVKHQFFPEKTRKKFQRLILKAGANDNYPFSPSGPSSSGGAHIRDSYVHTLAVRGGLNIDARTHRACILYVNGKYWGVYDLREKVDDHDFTDYNYGQAEADIDFIKTWGSTWAEYGSISEWQNLKNYILGNNMAVAANYNYVDARLDFLSLIDYVLLNQHTVCKDWLNWNTAWWRGRNPNGGAQKWRYALWDMDATFGHYTNYTGIPNVGPSADPCDVEAPSVDDPQGHIDIMVALFKNPNFKALYINRYADLLNSSFSCDYMNKLLDTLINEIEPEMNRQCQRWGGNFNTWKNNVQGVHNFINARCISIDQSVVDCYDVEGPFKLTVAVEPVGSPNQVGVNTITPANYPFVGDYFGGVKIDLKAKAAAGWAFDHWEIGGNTFTPGQLSADVQLNFAATGTATAFFILIDPCAAPSATTFSNFFEKTCDPALVGKDTAFLKNWKGCDSLRITTTTLLPKSQSVFNEKTCNPALVGTDTTFLKNILGCDSLVITATVFDAAGIDFTQIFEKNCDLAAVGVDTVFFKNSFGCDSLVEKTVELAVFSQSFLNKKTCNPAAVGTDTTFLKNHLGCDSLVITATVFDAAGIDFTQIFEKNCDPAAVGVDTIFFKNSFGCDSLVEKTVELAAFSQSFLSEKTCNPAAVGTDTTFLKNHLGCDSLVITATVFDAAGIDFTQIFEKNCDPAAVGVDTFFLKNSFGCDSLVEKTVSLAAFSESFLSEKTCNPTAVGTDTTFLKNHLGCDSLVITATIFDAAGIDFTQIFEKNCDPAAVGVDTIFFKNSFGCDSLVEKTVELAAFSESFLSEKTCNPAAVGTDTLFLKNSLGCDSLVITATVFDAAGIDFTQIFEKNCDPAAVGVDTIFFKNSFGCDSLVEKTVSLAAFSESFLSEKTCNPAAVGTDTTFLKNILGCDSLVITATVFDAAGIDFTQIFEKNCDPAAVGVDTFFLKNSFGCDSLVEKTTVYAGLEIAASATEMVCFDEKTGEIRLDSIVSGAGLPVSVSLKNQSDQQFLGAPLVWENLGGGIYSMVATNPAGCADSLEIEIAEGDQLGLYLGLTELTLRLGDSFLLDPVADFVIASAEWLPAMGLGCPTCPATFIKTETDGRYTLVAFDAHGCSATASVEVRVDREIRVFVPTAFRPGSDGPNGQLTIFGGPEISRLRSLRVFDRSGNQVFQQKNLAPNSPADWDGKYRGRELPPGVYVWWCEAEAVDGRVVVLKGDITLVR